MLRRVRTLLPTVGSRTGMPCWRGVAVSSLQGSCSDLQWLYVGDGKMIDFDREEETVTTVKFVIPESPGFGICWSDVWKVIRIAHQELWDSGRFPQGQDVPDDVIRLQAGDDSIVVSYQKSRLSDD